jgi:uncharacterized protein YecE (DUF72 family)
MKLYVGTSGYSYKEWVGNFYPPGLPARAMLEFYSGCLPAVEVNNTFYRMPKTSLLETWAAQVPGEFRFAIKASRRITHVKRLQGAMEETFYLLRSLEALRERLGVVLFQLPPNLKVDIGRLQQFAELIPGGVHAAFEFRHPSWLADEVVRCLHARDFACCMSDTDAAQAELIGGASWGYLRLRRSAYSDADLAWWAERVCNMHWESVFVFFKHEKAGTGPRLARRFLDVATAREARK